MMRIKRLIESAMAHPGVGRYFANTAWMFAEQGLRLVAGLLVGIWVARYLGPGQFGTFSYAIAFASMFTGIAKLGLDRIVVRDLVRTPELNDSYLGTAFWLKAGGALAMLGMVGLAVVMSGQSATTSMYILIIASGTVFQAFEVVDFYFQSKVLSKFVSMCKLTQLTVSSLLKIALIWLEADLFWFVLVSLIDQLILAISLYVAYRTRGNGSYYRHFEWQRAKELLRDSWPLIFSGVVLMVHARIDQVMIGEMMGSIELGYYSSALRLIEVFGFVPMILVTSLYPAIVNARKQSEEMYKDRLYNLYRLMMFLFLITAVPIYLFGEGIMLFLYGEAFAPAGALFALMATRLLFANYGVVRGAYLMTENLNRFALLTQIAGAATNILLNYLWIPVYHSVGAVWAAVASFFVTTFLVDLFYGRARGNLVMMGRSMLMVCGRKD
jgi:O-antigen/teichoic acid export membrane protein